MDLTVVFMVFAIVCLFFLAVGFVDGHRFVVVEERFKLPNLKKNCRFVMISDLHNTVYGDNNDRLINAVDSIKPDFIIIAGDMVTSVEHESMEPAIMLINELAKRYRIYYALGNHESKMKTQRDRFGDKYERLRASLNGKNIIFLENERCILDEYNLAITGLDLDLRYYAHFKKRRMDNDYLEKTINSAESGTCNLLVAHNPDYFPEYAKWGADLVLSGHVHGGIMRLPYLGGVIAPSYRLFPEYDGGIFEYGSSKMLLGRGMGSHTIPLRIFNPAELYAVTLEAGH